MLSYSSLRLVNASINYFINFIIFIQTVEISKRGIILPKAWQLKSNEVSTFPIPNGPNQGYDLALVQGEVLKNKAEEHLKN